MGAAHHLLIVGWLLKETTAPPGSIRGEYLGNRPGDDVLFEALDEPCLRKVVQQLVEVGDCLGVKLL